MKHYEVVCALIINNQGKIFCSKRGPGRALEGKWEFPGGKVELNEKHEQTIIREIKEELNIIVEPLEYIGKSFYEYHHLEPYADFSITLYAYKCKYIEGKLNLTEHTDYKWLTLNEMKDFEFAEADKVLIKLFSETSL